MQNSKLGWVWRARTGNLVGVDVQADDPAAGPLRHIESQQAGTAADVEGPLVGFQAFDEEIVVACVPVLGMGATAMGDGVASH